MSRLQDRRNAKRVNGLRRDPRTGAGKLAKSERGYGGVLAFDFTDQSAAIYDPTTAANISYTQGIADNGNRRGPGALLTYTSPSNKICRQADGYYKYGPHNLILQSEDFSTTWTRSGIDAFGSGSVVNATTAPDGATTAEFIRPTASNSVHVIYQLFTNVNGATYTASVCAKAAGYSYIGLSLSGAGQSEMIQMFNLSAGTVASSYGAGTVLSASIEPLGDDWYRCSLTGLHTGTASSGVNVWPHSTDANPRTSWTADGSSGVYVWGAHIYRYPANTDYIKTTSAAVYSLPYTYASDGSCDGLLVEEARTNLCLYSNDLTQAGSWTASNMTTAKTATGPDNVANSATTITATAGNATVLQAITSASAARVTSVFIKRRTGTGNIDLTQDNGSTWTTQAVDSTWTRFSLSSVTSANPTVGIRIVTSGDAVDVALFSHEVGAFVTSPIITYGATATRSADNISIATTAFPYSTTANTLAARFTSRASVVGGGAHLCEGGNTSIGYYVSQTTSARGAAGVSNTAAGSATTHIASASTTAWTDGGPNTSLVTSSATTAASYWNGTQINAVTSVTVNMTGLTNLMIGSLSTNGNSPINRHVKWVVVMPRNFSQSEAEAYTA